MGKKKSNQRRQSHHQPSTPKVVEEESAPAEDGFFSSLQALRTNYLWGGSGERSHSPPPSPKRTNIKRPKIESEQLKLKYDADLARLRNQLNDMKDSMNIKTNSHETLVRSLKRQIETHRQEAKDAQAHTLIVEAKMRDLEVKNMDITTQLKYHQDLALTMKTKMKQKEKELLAKKESQEKGLRVMHINVDEAMRSKTEAIKKMQKAEQMAQMAQNKAIALEQTVNELTFANQQNNDKWLNEREDLIKKIRVVQDELRQERESHQNIQMRVASAEENMEALIKEKDSLHAKFTSLQQQYEERKREETQRAQDASSNSEDATRAVEAANEERDEILKQKEQVDVELKRISAELSEVTESQGKIIQQRDGAIKDLEMVSQEKEGLFLDLSQMKGSYEEAMYEKEMAKKEAEEVRFALAQLKETAHEALQSKEEALKESERTRSKLSEIIASRDEAIQQRDDALKETERAMNELSLKGTNGEGTHQQVEEAFKQTQELRDQLAEMTTNYDELIHERDNAIKETEQVKLKLAEMETSLKEETVNSSEKVTNGLEEVRASLEKAIEEKEAALQESDKITNELSQLRSTYNVLLLEKQDNAKEIEKTARLISRLHDSLAAAESKAKAAQARAEEAESSKAELKDEIESLQRIQQQMDAPQTKNEHLTQEFLIKNMKRENRQLSNLVAMKDEEMKELLAKVKEMSEEQAILNADVSFSQDTRKQGQLDKAKLEEEVKTIRNNYEEIKKELEESNEEMFLKQVKFNSQVEELEDELNAAMELIKELGDRLEKEGLEKGVPVLKTLKKSPNDIVKPSPSSDSEAVEQATDVLASFFGVGES